MHPLLDETMIAFKRMVFRCSQYHDIAKKIRWWAEKLYTKFSTHAKPCSRNQAMNSDSDIHIIWPLYGKSKDILQEYFIPKRHLSQFLTGFASAIKFYQVNLLNTTMREVQKDTISALPYAKEDMFSLVCLFSQKNYREAEQHMVKFTQSAINLANSWSGAFYLPYRLDYTKQNLLGAYPKICNWIELKKNMMNMAYFIMHFMTTLPNWLSLNHKKPKHST